MSALFLTVPLMAIADPCAEWFQKSKLKPGPDCIAKCAALMTGMDTFTCPQQCKEFCTQKPDKCAALRSKLKNGRPKDGYLKTEKSKKWTPAEIKQVLQALQALPERLQSILKALYRMDSSVFGDNPGRETEDGIVLYDTALSEKYVLGRVLAHEISHTLFRQLSDTERSSYLEAAQWRKEAANSRFHVGRPKETFLSDHGRDSPGEDFAVNIEYYLFDSEQLKKITPRVYEWLNERYGSWLRLKHSDGDSQCAVSAY